MTKYHRLGGLPNRRQGTDQVCFILTPFLLACRQLHSTVCSYGLFFVECGQREKTPWCLFHFCKFRVPPLWLHLTLITFLKALTRNTVTWGIRTSTYEFWGNTIQSIAVSKFWLVGKINIRKEALLVRIKNHKKRSDKLMNKHVFWNQVNSHTYSKGLLIIAEKYCLLRRQEHILKSSKNTKHVSKSLSLFSHALFVLSWLWLLFIKKKKSLGFT